MSIPTSIDDLPPEMVSELFKHLCPKDLVACSMVNKCWHSIYSGFKVHRLVTTEDRDFYGITSWSYSDRKIEYRERCLPAMFGRLADRSLLSNLQHLALWGNLPQFDLNQLNRFRQLVHLEIIGDLSAEKLNLNLLRLGVLALYTFNWGCSLLIDCPNSACCFTVERAKRKIC